MAMTRAGIVYYLAYDQVGSLRVVADSAGNIVKRIDYDSFGNILYDSNPGFTVPFGFAGGLQDRDTGLVRFGFRDYDPDIGRWTAKDPIFFAGGSSDLYGYCMNDPVNFEDSFGLALTERQRLIVSVAGSIGAVVGSIAVGATTWGIGTPVGAAVGGALFSAAAASLLGGDLAEVSSAFVSNLGAGYLGAGIGSLMYSISRTGLQASLRTGALAGALKALMFESDPLFGSGGPDSASPCMK
jgi:RHS repeat-associated protein